MKVLQINKLYAPDIGGIETVVKDIAEGLCEQVDMRVLVCQRKGRRVNEIINGVDVLRASSWGMFFSMPFSLDFIGQYWRMSGDAQIIQLHAPFPLADLAIWLIRRKSKLVVWWHSDIFRQRFLRKLFYPFIKYTLRRADVILVTDEAVIDASVYLPRYRNKCRVIPFGLDFSAYPVPANGLLSGLLNNKARVKVLFVGRLVYYKGIEILLKAMKTVCGAELFIVGNGVLECTLKKSVEISGINETVHFLGTLPNDELLAAYYDCDMLVLPSIANSEMFGICQLEAMFYGKPVINTDLPTAVPTVSINGQTGLTVPPGDAVALAEAINKLVKDAALRHTYGIAASQRVRRKYDREQMIEAVYTCYENSI